jgi:TrmH family RNA methyltransferase
MGVGRSPTRTLTPLSLRNPRVQRLRRLATRRSDRVAEGAYLVEGPVLVRDAIEAGVTLESAYVEERAGSPSIDDAVARLDDAGVAVFDVADGVLARLGAAVTPQGIAAVARLRVAPLDEAATTPEILVLVDVADPGNAGTLLRTAEAAGFGSVVFAGSSVDPFGPKAVRASAGSVFRVPVAVEPDAVTALDVIGAAGHRRVAATMGEGRPWHEADLAPPVAVVLGGEAHGLPPAVTARIDDRVHLPMAGRVESLNVAVTGAVILFEAARRRTEPIGRNHGETTGLHAHG